MQRGPVPYIEYTIDVSVITDSEDPFQGATVLNSGTILVGTSESVVAFSLSEDCSTVTATTSFKTDGTVVDVSQLYSDASVAAILVSGDDETTAEVEFISIEDGVIVTARPTVVVDLSGGDMQGVSRRENAPTCKWMSVTSGIPPPSPFYMGEDQDILLLTRNCQEDQDVNVLFVTIDGDVLATGTVARPESDFIGGNHHFAFLLSSAP